MIAVDAVGTFNAWLFDFKSEFDTLVGADVKFLEEDNDSEDYPAVHSDVYRLDGWDERRLQAYISLWLHVKFQFKDKLKIFRLIQRLNEKLGFAENKAPTNPIAMVDVIPVNSILQGDLAANTTVRLGSLEVRASKDGWTDYSTESAQKYMRNLLIYY